MKILITNNTLAKLGGSEWVAIELAKTLISRGHDVVACSSQIGEAGSLLRGMSVLAIPDPLSSPFKPDVIHGQHHLDTMRALCAFPDVPAIYHCHGYMPWVEDPPIHPRILYYAGMCSSISKRICLLLGLDDQKVKTVPNWVDLGRFRFVRKLAQKPRNALLYLRSFDRNSWHASQLRQAFETMDIKLDLWLPQGDMRAPEVVLPEYDIVLASGRSAIEAMACGCAVMPISPSSCLDLVDLSNFDLFQSQNFSPKLSGGHFNAQAIINAISLYDPARVAAVTALVRSKCTLEAAVDILESLYVRAVKEFNEQCSPPSIRHIDELRALTKYIQSVMPMVRDRERLLVENHDLQQLVAMKEQTIGALLRCNSMRITGPLRLIRNLARRLGSSKLKPVKSLTA
jgi:hypothetical protein